MTAVTITLEGGLCNKLFHLFSACDIAIGLGTKIIEPMFGWKNKVLFSEIYDISFFNNFMKKFNNGEELIIPYEHRAKYKIIKIKHDLWKNSENILRNQRKSNQIKSDCMMVVVLNALKLNERNLQLCNDVHNIENKCALHVRIEEDWVKYSRKKQPVTNKKELYLIDILSLIELYKNHGFKDEIFFTTGQDHRHVQRQIISNGIQSTYTFISALEYEVNAAINFELCCRANAFIGLSRSTFSNLVSLKRCLLNKNMSYIYNYQGEICLRVDKGLHPCPKDARSNKVYIV